MDYSPYYLLAHLEGLMTSSEGAAAVPWRAWETRAQNLARGVRGEDIPEDPPWVKDKKM